MAKFCTNCGTEIGDTFKFCPSCGTAVVNNENLIKDNSNISNEYMEYQEENGEAKFYTFVSLGKGKTVKLERAKDNGARLCKNGIIAMEELKKEGYEFKNVEMYSLLNRQFELSNPNCNIIPPEAIEKLYKVNNFFDLLGYEMIWEELPELFHVELSEFSKLKILDIIKTVLKAKINMDLPIEGGEELREGETYLIRSDLDRALEWYIDDYNSHGDENGYSSNIIGRIYYNSITGNENVSRFTDALAWLKKSAECNNTLGCINLGRMYAFGTGIKKDCDVALELYLKAYEQKSEYSIKEFNKFFKSNFVEIHESGFRMDRDYSYELLADECEEKAESNDGLSILNIGYMYHYGLGRTISIEKAVSYYKKAVFENKNVSSYAIRFINCIRDDGNDYIINNDEDEQKLKQIAKLSKTLSENIEKEKLVKEQLFNEKPPQKPEYQGFFVLDGSVEYPPHICFSEEELALEKDVYNMVIGIYNSCFENWKEKRNLILSGINTRISEANSELNTLRSSLKISLPSWSNNHKAMAFAYDCFEATGVTIEEGLLEYHNIGNVLISKINKEKSLSENLGELLVIENQIRQLQNEDSKLKKGNFGKIKPIKPTYQMALEENAPLNHYKGIICASEAEYKHQLDIFFNELNAYYNEKLQWLNIQPENRLKIKIRIEDLQHKAAAFYKYFEIPRQYNNLEAIDYINRYILVTNGTLQSAYEDYEAYLHTEKENTQKELEKKRRIEAEQERIRIEKAKERLAQWDKEAEELENARLYESQESSESALGGFIRDVASTAIGASIANRGIKKELRKQRKADEERERKREKEQRDAEISRKQDEFFRRGREERERREREKKERFERQREENERIKREREEYERRKRRK